MLARIQGTQGVLLKHYEIKKPLFAYHKFNETDKSSYIIELLSEGKSIAIVSDAGSPGISDPGVIAARAARDAGYTVTAIPGATAFVTSLMASGLDLSHFAFIGFAPQKDAKRKKFMEIYKSYTMPLIYYEAPHRLIAFLNTALEVYGDRMIFISRELTKVFEENLYMRISEAIAHFTENEPRGEFVITITGLEDGDDGETIDINEAARALIDEGLSMKDATNKLKELGFKKNDAYKALLEIKEE
ncbi:16S rRNA (cytidine(1402)-2'-O)-methyltransferase [Fenollaria massiliensis]|uniref:16S rRNA (cytidine(1402)-2'-O)-methyltransferase n=1 Tax=Fenollaria massiliensis TaxID=938288 RepID=UPI0004B1D7B7|nr:16S rRNA (cytidine(1402)-2'-O)-methyltransferase [Fenollaria massiliensis]